MAQEVLTDAFVSIGGVEYSDQVKSVTLDYSRDEVDDTAMGDSTHSRTGGLYDWSGSIDFKQDEAAGQTGANLFTVLGTTAAIIIRPNNTDGVAADNPNYTGTAYYGQYTPLGGGVGELNMGRISFSAAGGALSRATS